MPRRRWINSRTYTGEFQVATVKTQQEVLTDISEKLDNILGFMAIRGIENDLGAVVARLSGFGMTQKAIARVAGLTENAVQLRLSRQKKPKTKKPVNKAGKRSVKVAAPDSPTSAASENGEVRS